MAGVCVHCLTPAETHLKPLTSGQFSQPYICTLCNQHASGTVAATTAESSSHILCPDWAVPGQTLGTLPAAGTTRRRTAPRSTFRLLVHLARTQHLSSSPRCHRKARSSSLCLFWSLADTASIQRFSHPLLHRNTTCPQPLWPTTRTRRRMDLLLAKMVRRPVTLSSHPKFITTPVPTILRTQAPHLRRAQ